MSLMLIIILKKKKKEHDTSLWLTELKKIIISGFYVMDIVDIEAWTWLAYCFLFYLLLVVHYCKYNLWRLLVLWTKKRWEKWLHMISYQAILYYKWLYDAGGKVRYVLCEIHLAFHSSPSTPNTTSTSYTNLCWIIMSSCQSITGAVYHFQPHIEMCYKLKERHFIQRYFVLVFPLICHLSIYRIVTLASSTNTLYIFFLLLPDIILLNKHIQPLPLQTSEITFRSSSTDMKNLREFLGHKNAEFKECLSNGMNTNMSNGSVMLRTITQILVGNTF